MEKTAIGPGERVHYTSPHGAKENGIVKSMREPNHAFVVFNCNNDWDNYKDYTGQGCSTSDLTLGWVGETADTPTPKKRMIIEARDFNFWRENQTKNHFQLSGSKLMDKFRPWLASKDIEWLEYYASEMVVRTFITENNGLNSTFEEKDFELIMSLLKPIYYSHLKLEI